MTEQRNSRIALLAVVMLLSGAFLGLVVSDNASAARYDINGLFLITMPMYQSQYWIEIQDTENNINT